MIGDCNHPSNQSSYLTCLPSYESKYQKQYIEEKRKEKQALGNAYDSIMKEENMYSNKGYDLSKTAAEIEEDFM